MSVSPGPNGVGNRYEVVVQSGRGSVLAARLRAARHGGRVRLRRLRSWLRTPEGRRVVMNSGRGLALVAAVLGGWMLVRRWAASARGALAAVAAGYRSAAGAVGAVGAGVRFVLSLRWLSELLRWFSAAGLTRANVTDQRRSGHSHYHCPDCHARIRTDAGVCYRCGHRPSAEDRDRARGAVLGTLVWTWRVLLLRLYHRCPDCRRRVHADARVCYSCGFRLRSSEDPTRLRRRMPRNARPDRA